jgi:hypothetical protein
MIERPPHFAARYIELTAHGFGQIGGMGRNFGLKLHDQRMTTPQGYNQFLMQTLQIAKVLGHKFSEN